VYFLGGKGGRYIRLTNLPPSCAVVKKSGNLNFLETSGKFQACNGTALTFTAVGEDHEDKGYTAEKQALAVRAPSNI
jgi:hypothetical protein